jgi:hypothetical protein
MNRNVGAVVSVVSLLCASGCIARRPVWLPNSSGFLYTSTASEGGKVVVYQYDISTRARRTLGFANQHAVIPGVSPDGKRVATVEVQRRTERESKPLMRVVTATMAGQIESASGWYECDSISPELAIEWPVVGSRLLLYDLGGVLLFDRSTGEFRRLHGVRVNVFTLLFGMPASLPDGTGFLAQHDWDDPAAPFVVVDWNGFERDVKATPSWLELMSKEQAQSQPQPGRAGRDETGRSTSSSSDLIGAGGWEGATLRMRYKGGELVVNTRERTAAFNGQPDALDAKTARESLILYQGQAFSIRKRAVPRGAADPARAAQDAKSVVRVELFRPGDGSARTLLEGDAAKVGVFVSPNKEYIVLMQLNLPVGEGPGTATGPASEGRRFTIISSGGEVLDQFEVR